MLSIDTGRAWAGGVIGAAKCRGGASTEGACDLGGRRQRPHKAAGGTQRPIILASLLTAEGWDSRPAWHVGGALYPRVVVG